jgi:hypothetical protein
MQSLDPTVRNPHYLPQLAAVIFGQLVSAVNYFQWLQACFLYCGMEAHEGRVLWICEGIEQVQKSLVCWDTGPCLERGHPISTTLSWSCCQQIFQSIKLQLTISITFTNCMVCPQSIISDMSSLSSWPTSRVADELILPPWNKQVCRWSTPTNACPAKWCSLFSLYNTHPTTLRWTNLHLSSSTVMNEPQHLGIEVAESCALVDLQQWLHQLSIMTSLQCAQ